MWSMQFARKPHLNRHMLTHTDEKPFLCEYCGTQFRLLANLNQHIKNNHCKENVIF